MKESYDVIVVGAGPAGSFAAKTAAEQGASVLMIDRRKELGSPVRCGEGLGVEYVQKLGLRVDRRWVAADISGAAMFSPNGKRITVKNERTKGFVLERKIFDKFLAADAIRAGAGSVVKTEVTAVLKDGNAISGVRAINERGEQFEAKSKVLIAADGGESTIARMAGVNTTATLYDTDFGYEYEMVNVECEDVIELYFGKSVADRGYVWVFPKGKDVANVGVGVGGLAKENARYYLDRFIAAHPERFANAYPVEVKGGVIPVGEPCKKIVANGIMVVGTAAHQVDPIHGGGIGLAAEAGIIAGSVAAEAAKAGDASERFLSKYDKEWRAKAEKKLLSRLKLRKVLEKLNDDDWNAIFEHLDSNDVDLLLRGHFAGVAKKVITKRPQLLKVVSALL